MRDTSRHILPRRLFLQTFLAAAAMPAAAGAPLVSVRPPGGRGPVAPPAAEYLVEKAGLKGKVVFAVSDRATGDLLESRMPDIAVAPASVTKAITALYAIDTLGADHRFKTRIIATGGVANGVVKGDLVLAGGCDPTTDTRAYAELASRLKEAGIHEVRGRFLVYEGPIGKTRSIDPEQPEHVGYSPGVSGIALNFNRVHFEWKRSGDDYTVTMDARAGSYRPDVVVSRMAVVERSAPVYTYKDADDRDNWTVASGALGREGARWLPVRKPGLYAGEVFATLARAHGIVLWPPKISANLPEGVVLAEIESDPLAEILRAMLEHSNNLIAEMVGLASTHARTGKVTNLAGSAAVMNDWARSRLGMTAPFFVDHSGLGGANRVTAHDMVQGLASVGHADLLRPLLNPVKLMDAQGRPVKDHPVEAAAKTGTLNFVSGLAGYITTPDGRDLVFAVFAADETRRAALSREERERPPGGRSYAARARRLQKQLIMRWGRAFEKAAG